MIENSSSRRIKSIDVELVQKITVRMSYIAYCKPRIITHSIFNKIAKVKFSRKIEPKNQDRWDNVSLAVPPICPSNGLCRIFELNYFLKLNYYPEGFYISSYSGLFIPITIGTIPLMNEVMQSDFTSYAYDPSSVNGSSSNNNDIPPGYEAIADQMAESNANTVNLD